MIHYAFFNDTATVNDSSFNGSKLQKHKQGRVTFAGNDWLDQNSAGMYCIKKLLFSIDLTGNTTVLVHVRGIQTFNFSQILNSVRWR